MNLDPKKTFPFSRRVLLGVAGASALIHLLPSTCAAQNEPDNPEASWMRVRSIVELKGEVRLRDEKAVMKGAMKTAPIESMTTLDYEENAISVEEGFRGAFGYRNILEAKFDSRINKQPVTASLRSECKNVLLGFDGMSSWIASADAPLTANERDLVRGTLGSSFFDEMLPKKAIRVGDTWDLASESVRRIFLLDSVLTTSLKLSLVEADQDKAHIDLSGKVEGVASDVSTELQIRGKIQADRKLGLVTWVAMNVEETREIGEAEPGFKVQSRIRILRAPQENPVATESLASASSRVKPDMTRLLQFSSSHNGFEFLADSDWKVLQDNADQMVLRYVKNNTVIAQCNIKRLASLEAGRQTTLEGFQEIVSRSLSESFKQFIESSEGVTETGLRMLRTLAYGEAQGVPVQWISVLLSDDHGHRATLTFTMDQSMENRFQNADVGLTSGFQLAPQTPSSIAKPTATVPKVGTTSKQNESR